MVTEDIASDLPFNDTPAGPASLHFAARNQFDKSDQLLLGARQGTDFAIATHRRDRPGLGPTVPTPVGAAYLVVVQLRPGGRCDILCDARHEARGELRTGGISIMDLRHLWVADLQHPFHSFSFVVPQSMLDELTDDLGQPRISSLQCSLSEGKEDQVMLSLARALYPALEQPGQASALASTHLFEAANVHLAQHYGGLEADSIGSISGLAAWQERRAKEMLGDNLRGDPTLDQLSRECGLPSFRFAKAFERSVGAPPHQWLMQRRIDSAKNLLACTAQSSEAIARFCGFSDASYFRRAFTRSVSVSPDRWRSSRRQ
jgi:AraC family transcriptional regulator